MHPAPTAMASEPTGAPATAPASTIAAPTTAVMSRRLDRPRPLGPEPDRHRIDPGRRVALEVGPGVRDGEPGPGHDGDRQQHREGGRQAAGRAEPAEHGQQRDADRERDPRPGRPLEGEVVAVPDREDDDGQRDRPRARRGAEHEPENGRRPRPRPGRSRPTRARPGWACRACGPHHGERRPRR